MFVFLIVFGFCELFLGILDYSVFGFRRRFRGVYELFCRGSSGVVNVSSSVVDVD